MRIAIWTPALALLLLAGCEDLDPEEPAPVEQAEEELEEEEEQAAGAVEAQQPEPAPPSQRAELMDAVDRAVAVLQPTEGNELSGTVRFETAGNEVRVIADIQGLEPGSRHGFHVHQYGDCTAADGTSAGGHYSPDEQPHELPPEQPRHAGDMGNVEANDEGRVHLEQTFDTFSIAGAQDPVLGRAVILHAQPDTGQGPTSEAGPRMACGVIGVAQPEGQGEG